MQDNQRDANGQSFEKVANGSLRVLSISLPKNGGVIRGIGEKFSVNASNGSTSMTVPLFTTASRSNFYPQLSISYDSGSGNGAFGLGWNLSIPSITRKTDKGLPEYRDGEDSNVFILSDAEDLVPALIPNGTSYEKEGNSNRDGPLFVIAPSLAKMMPCASRLRGASAPPCHNVTCLGRPADFEVDRDFREGQVIYC